jgi:outer membrane protein TolC
VLESSLPSAEQAVAQATEVQERATKLYMAGEISLAELFDVYRSAEEARLARLELVYRVALVRVALMRALGSFFDPALDRACQLPARTAR